MCTECVRGWPLAAAAGDSVREAECVQGGSLAPQHTAAVVFSGALMSDTHLVGEGTVHAVAVRRDLLDD